MAAVRKLLSRHDVYSLFRYFSYIRDAGYGEEFMDVGDGQTSLSRGSSNGWLASDHPIWYTGAGIPAIWSRMSPAGMLVSSVGPKAFHPSFDDD